MLRRYTFFLLLFIPLYKRNREGKNDAERGYHNPNPLCVRGDRTPRIERSWNSDDVYVQSLR